MKSESRIFDIYLHFDVSMTIGSTLYFREHAMLAKTAGVKHLVVLVNKMDDPTVEWDEGRLVCFGIFRNQHNLSISCLEIHFVCVCFSIVSQVQTVDV